MLSKFQLYGKQVDIVNEFKSISPVRDAYRMLDNRPVIFEYQRLIEPYLLEEVKKRYDVDWLISARIGDSNTYFIQARCFTGDADDAMAFTFRFRFKGLNIEDFFDIETTIEHHDDVFTVKPVEVGEEVLKEI